MYSSIYQEKSGRDLYNQLCRFHSRGGLETILGEAVALRNECNDDIELIGYLLKCDLMQRPHSAKVTYISKAQKTHQQKWLLSYLSSQN